MARIELPMITTLDSAARAQYDRFPSNLTRALLCTSGCAHGYLELGYSLRATQLSAKYYELVILHVAALSGSAYERMQHLPPAHEAGWSEADIQAIEAGPRHALDEASRALLAFVDECVRDVRVTERTFARLRQHLSEGAVADVVLLTGFYMMTARFLETLAVDCDAVPSDILMRR